MLTNICLVKAMVFPVVMYGCENWTLKKAECQRIDAFELWCWKRLLRVPWTARRSNQSILKEISPGYSLEGLMLKLRLQFFGHLIWRTDSFEKTLMVGEGDDRGWMASPTGWTWVWVNSGSWSWTGRPGMLQSMGSQSQTWLTELNWTESVKITFICTWKQKSLCDSLCCCICSLAVVWNWTCHISEPHLRGMPVPTCSSQCRCFWLIAFSKQLMLFFHGFPLHPTFLATPAGC